MADARRDGLRAGGEGVDFRDGLRINKTDNGAFLVTKVDLSGKGVAFYDSDNGDRAEFVELAQWIDAILNDTNPCVLPEQACMVTGILEAIYTSQKTGEAVYF